MPKPATVCNATVAILAAGLVAACAGSAPGTSSAGGQPTASASPQASPPGSSQPTGQPSTLSPGSTAGPLIDAAWAQVELTDVQTGERFRIADFAGRVIVVEPMAVWCTNCKAQQREGAAMLGELPDVVWIALDIDPGESPELLAGAATERGHVFRWAIAPPDLSRGLEADFGTIVLNPVPTPLILIGTDGRITLTDFGLKDATTLVGLARDHGA
jgi:hypothetical protein